MYLVELLAVLSTTRKLLFWNTLVFFSSGVCLYSLLNLLKLVLKKSHLFTLVESVFA